MRDLTPLSAGLLREGSLWRVVPHVGPPARASCPSQGRGVPTEQMQQGSALIPGLVHF